jgi:fumarate reductase flavoprotein subunit
MVERCADCGFDLAGGSVEVIPTAHYMMGGVQFAPDCTTEMPGLYAAGEDTGGVHGANRLGGNGVANSTVYGGLAGDRMGERIKPGAPLREPNRVALEEAESRAYAPLGKPGGDLEAVRRELHSIMWDDVGILRSAETLTRATHTLARLARDIAEMGVRDGERRYNLTWMDRLNLENMILTSRAICAAALAREDSRGAHFREDFPERGALEDSRYTVARYAHDHVVVSTEAVEFTHVRPGESLIKDAAE